MTCISRSARSHGSKALIYTISNCLSTLGVLGNNLQVYVCVQSSFRSFLHLILYSRHDQRNLYSDILRISEAYLDRPPIFFSLSARAVWTGSASRPSPRSVIIWIPLCVPVWKTPLRDSLRGMDKQKDNCCIASELRISLN